MDINFLLIIIQFFSVIITLISVIILYKTIQNNKILNQNNLFNELVGQERELRVKLNEYRKEIYKLRRKNTIGITLDYDTLLFNYYEYVAICVHQQLINEKIIIKYFKQLLISVKEKFDNSILFKKNYAKKEDYPGIQWLFNRWEIEY